MSGMHALVALGRAVVFISQGAGSTVVETEVKTRCGGYVFGSQERCSGRWRHSLHWLACVTDIRLAHNHRGHLLGISKTSPSVPDTTHCIQRLGAWPRAGICSSSCNLCRDMHPLPWSLGRGWTAHSSRQNGVNSRRSRCRAKDKLE